MKQMYKEIAGINKCLVQLLRAEGYQDWDRLPLKAIKEHIIRQADYFERTQCMDDTCDCHVLGRNIDCCIVCSPHKDNIFNKQQFLKDCGVK